VILLLTTLHRQASTHVVERQLGERVITVGRPIRDAELETKSASRSEKLERPRSNELMQSTPLVVIGS